MKNTAFKIVATLLAIVCLCIGFVVPTQTTAKAETTTDVPSGYEEVFSYEDVFAHYYNSAQSRLAQRNTQLTMSYEQFCSSYYEQQLPIGEFTESVVDEELESQEDSSTVTPRDSSLSEDEDYILTSLTDYATTPASAFRRVPNYNGYQGKTFDYSLLKDGDIVYETKTVLFNTGHTAIITDTDHPSAYGSYVQTIEAVLHGVQFGFLDDNRMVEFGVKILRVNALPQYISSVISFVKSQLGKAYYCDFKTHTSPNETTWYCSELIFAAYYNAADINILMYKTASSTFVYPLTALPLDVYNGMHTYCVNIENANYVNIELDHGDRWQVTIYNERDTTIQVAYNSKMCVKNNAKNWTNLNNILYVTIPPYGERTVTINENFLCGYIAVSYYTNGQRYITYADGLQAGPYEMNIYYNTI